MYLRFLWDLLFWVISKRVKPGFFLFDVIPDRHERESEIEHNRKRPRESEIDGVQSFQVLDEDHDKADGEKSKAQLGFG
jgi:hypothetical protein